MVSPINVPMQDSVLQRATARDKETQIEAAEGVVEPVAGSEEPKGRKKSRWQIPMSRVPNAV